MTGLTEGALDLFGVEAFLRGELHELRVLGIAKFFRAAVWSEPSERIWSFMKSVPLCIIIDGP
ncbi:hypothetical protein SMICM304S_08813 [Streptomyces microflavus]